MKIERPAGSLCEGGDRIGRERRERERGERAI